MGGKKRVGERGRRFFVERKKANNEIVDFLGRDVGGGDPSGAHTQYANDVQVAAVVHAAVVAAVAPAAAAGQ